MSRIQFKKNISTSSKLANLVINTNIAFTLAEVLITLSIIGIIAALTIPGLVQETQDAQFKTSLKENYGILEGATKRALLDNGGSFKGLFPNNYYNGAKWFAEQYIKYLNYTKYCPNMTDPNAPQGCWHPIDSFKYTGSTDGRALKQLNGTIFDSNVAGYPAILLTNGSMILFHATNDPTCPSSGLPFNRCGDIVIDLNGFKGPNTLGKDLFYTWISDRGIKPYGVQGDWYTPSASCVPGSTNPSNSGGGCTAKYLMQ